MRQDMAKVFYERGRTGGAKYASPLQFLDGESLTPTRESMTQHYSWLNEETKSSRLRFKALRRFLTANVGKPWTEVYAEIRATIKGITLHEMRWKLRDVAVDTYLGTDGEVLANSDWRGVVSASSYFDFYVHPTTGLLMANEFLHGQPGQSRRHRRALHQASEDANRRVIGERVQLHRVEGIWYEVTLAEYDNSPATESYGRVVFDVLEGRLHIACGDCWPEGAKARGVVALYGRAGVYGAAKRQLNHGELKRFGLLAH